ncbi:MAG: DUF3108 domain-containing protein [Dinoroseobacter sp.]|nr:DUF3108 domain-containing protein [Dinoroseobacter sp.]MDJ0994808.1 DUF3108 domain-containing protein [Dinoroseobacter sp.]
MTALRVAKCALALATGLICLPVWAQSETATFDLKIRGITAASATFAANVSGQDYAVSGKMRTTGLVGTLVRAGYDGSAYGRLRGENGYRSFSFTEKRVGRGETATASIRYNSGVPKVVSVSPPEDPGPFAVDPAKQAGTVDPMTAIWAALRDRPRDQVCALDLVVFDGDKRSGIRLRNPRENADGTITCQAEYRRIAGWSPEKLAERKSFPFTMTYTKKADGIWQVARAVSETRYGTAELTRRK